MQKFIAARRVNARPQDKPASTSVPQLGAIVGLLALCLTLMTALLYALAQAWNTGYLHAYGVEAALFTDTWHTSIYTGSLVGLGVAFVAAAGLGSAGLTYLAFAWLIGAVNLVRGSSAPPSWVLWILGKVGVVKPHDGIMGMGMLSFGLALLLALVYWFYAWTLELAVKAGVTQATAEMAMIKAGDAKAMESKKLVRLTITRMENNSPITETGIVINCQVDTFCAIRLPDTTSIFPTKSVVRIQGEQVKA